jgi:hypothetical protein
MPNGPHAIMLPQPDPANPANLIPILRPVSPVRPPPPAGNANSAAIAQCNRLTLEFTEFSNAISVLKLEMLSSIGATIRTELEDPTYGHALLSPLQIRTHVNNKYDTLKEVDLTELSARLETFQHNDTLRSFITASTAVHRVLETNGQGKSQIDMMQAFERGLSSRPHLTQLVTLYKQSVPRIADRTYNAMTTFVEAHETSTTAADMGYSASATSIITLPPAYDHQIEGHP